MDNWARNSKTFADGVIFTRSDAGGKSVSEQTLNLNSDEPFLITDLYGGDVGSGIRLSVE